MPKGIRIFRHGVAVLAAILCLSATRDVAAQNGNHRWSAFVSGRGGLFRTGVETEAGAASATDSMANATASLSYSRYTRSSLVTLSGWVSNLFVSDLDFGNFGASASGFKQASEKATLRFAAGGSRGFNYNDLIVNGIFFLDQDITSYYGTGGFSYDFSAKTSASADLSYTRFRFDVTQEIDGSQFVFALPFGEEPLNPQMPTNLPFSSTTVENIFDASRITAGLLATEGALVNEFTTDIYALNGGLSHQLSASTDVRGRAGYRWLSYRRPAIVEGADWYTGAVLGHEFNTKTDVTVEYTFRQNQVIRPYVRSHTALGAVGRQISVPLRVDASFGITYVPVRNVDPSTFLYIGGAAISGEYTRTAFSVDYRHQAQHSVGIGRFLTSDFFSAGVNRIFTRDWYGYAYAGYRHSRGTFEESFSFGVLVAGGDVRYRINEDFSAGASYLFRRLGRDDVTSNAHVLSAVLSFSRIWR